MIVSRKTVFVALANFCLCGLLSGCSLSRFSDPSTATSALPQISGRVHGGQQPVSGATIQLYAANTTASKGLSTPLLTTTVVTDASGNFSITHGYTCPTPTTLVYLVATGGNPGLGGTVNNSALALMAVLGTCETLTDSTYIVVNELTTVVSVLALAPFMADVAHVGSTASNVLGLTGAFAGATAFVDFSTGTFRTSFASGVTPPAQLLDTLADILAACVNTTGAGPVCGNLLLYATNGPTTDTILAMLHIAQLPAQNVPQLFALIPGTPPFQPYLLAAPVDFTPAISISLPLPSSYPIIGYKMAIDAAQHIWVYTPNTNASDMSTSGSITVYDNNGALLYTIASGSGGLFSPSQLAADPSGNVWVLNSNATLSKFSSTGTAISPSGGFAFPAFLGTTPISVEGNNPTITTSMTIDPSGNVWAAYEGRCYIEFGSNGSVVLNPVQIIAPACPGIPGNALAALAFAADGSGDVFISATASPGVGTVYEINSSGSLLSPTSGYTGISTGAAGDAMVYDRAQNELWVRQGINGIKAIKSNGTAVSPSSGFTLPYGVVELEGIAVDGSGNLWFGSIPTAALHELDPSGNILTPNTPTASGLGAVGNGSPGGIGVDAYGNIWMIDDYNHTLSKISGLATPKSYQ